MTRPRDPEFEEWVARARAVPIDRALEVAAPGHLARLRRGRVERVGPCPVCGGTDRFAINLRKNIFNCRRCDCGGGAIELVELVSPREPFLLVCERLVGEPPPARASAETAEDRARRRAEAKARLDALEREKAEREKTERALREKARERARALYAAGLPWRGTPVEAYLRGRGLAPVVDAGLPMPLRFAPACGYFDEAGRKLFEGPAMLVPIYDSERALIGVHRTWIDPERPGAKLEREHSATGARLDPKKTLGSVAGGIIPLIAGGGPVTRLFLGEGMETALSAPAALLATHRWRAGDAAAAAIDLGNMAGPSGADRRSPDFTRPAVPVPAGVTRLVLMKDGDTKPGARIEDVMARAAARHAAPGRTVTIADPGPGRDFNDLIKGAA